MKDPVRAAAAVPSIAGFTNDVLAHLEPGGYVLSAPDYFLCARAVPSDADIESVLNPWMRWPADRCDCWFIWMLAGSASDAMSALLAVGGAKEWVAFQRGGRVKLTKLNPKLRWLKAAKAGETPKQ